MYYTFKFHKIVRCNIKKACGAGAPGYTSQSVTRSLKNNYFPNASTLVDELNETILDAIVEIAIQLNTTLPSTGPFKCDDQNIVTFTENKAYDVHIDPYVEKMLNFETVAGALKTKSSTRSIEIKLYKRSLFYVHCDCLDRRYVNHLITDLLKTVTNEADNGEKHTVVISDGQYHKVSRRLVSCINMYITDQIFKGILEFENDIVYTLHFRKCSS